MRYSTIMLIAFIVTLLTIQYATAEVNVQVTEKRIVQINKGSVPICIRDQDTLRIPVPTFNLRNASFFEKVAYRMSTKSLTYSWNKFTNAISDLWGSFVSYSKTVIS